MVFNRIMKDSKNINCLINFSIRPWKKITKYRNKFTIHFTSNNTYNNSHHRRDAFLLNRPGTAGLAAGAAGRLAARAGMTGRGVLFALDAPWPLARQALPRQRSALLVVATSALCRATMHGAAQAFGRAREIGAAKNVSPCLVGWSFGFWLL